MTHHHAPGRSLLGPAHATHGQQPAATGQWLSGGNGGERRASNDPGGDRPGDPTADQSPPDPSGQRAVRGDSGSRARKLLVPYLTAGVTENWVDYLFAMQDSGADAIEIGFPFSDPMLDGVTVQRSSDQALARGVTVASILCELRDVRDRVRVPLIAFIYSNLVFRPGPAAFCRQLAQTGFSGLIVPDLPLDEAAEVEAAAAAAGIELTLLVAPVTPDDRLVEIVARSRGYVYAISHMGTTGERNALASSAATLAARIKAAQTAQIAAAAQTAGAAGPHRETGPAQSASGLSDRGFGASRGRPVGSGSRVPVLVGFGISGVEQAAAAARVGDGVVVGSALMRRVLDGATPLELGAEVAALRGALDALDEEASADRTAHAEVSGDRR